jgi:hypothetical protein
MAFITASMVNANVPGSAETLRVIVHPLKNFFSACSFWGQESSLLPLL